MPEITRSPAARRDLDGLWDVIAEHDPAAAEKLLRTIEQKCRLLAGNPLLGEAWPELGENIRFFTVRRTWVIIYRPADDGIELVRVVHGARDIPSLFDG
jgi:toxin ParE1/3/4